MTEKSWESGLTFKRASAIAGVALNVLLDQNYVFQGLTLKCG